MCYKIPLTTIIGCTYLYNCFDTLLPFFFFCSSQIFVIHECKGLSFINLLVLKHRRWRIERLQVEDGQGEVNSKFCLQCPRAAHSLHSDSKVYFIWNKSKHIYIVAFSKEHLWKMNPKIQSSIIYFMYCVYISFSDVAVNVSLRNIMWVKFF